ncbi:penicillin acylase family protein [Flavobacteriaceae bacterium F89]|uniref:Penicillin acylase family protein n=1 Tax=Cerina litoralis TaxID=2874477 RepID=A0AAE3JQK9_9FLAO|nr:penicillin acylase family protein [Cerina litoralis]MCG2461984.1 penicillin acylase family protein [Cerina litoralis]
MKLLKKIVGIFLIILAIVAIAIVFAVNSLKPDYDGEKKMVGLSQDVKVYFDTYGIPHIYAENEKDAFKALGYVHAQDRLWQMELLRRIAGGRLSEIFGADLVKTDKFYLALGIDEASSKTIAHIDTTDQAVQLSQAYLDGINLFMEEGPTPIEFYLTGVKKKPFELKDIYNTIGYMAFSFAQAQKTDPLLTNIRNQLGAAYLQDLEVMSDTGTTWIKNYRPESNSVRNNLSKMVAEAMDKLPVPQFVGSNSWVIAPEKTKAGKVILANDPHIGFAQPSVWYEAHISSPTYENYGYYIAGIPFPLLGHNRKLAYGLTMFQNDDADFYYEANNPEDTTSYKTLEGWEKYETVHRTIKVKDHKDVSFTFKKSRHGPILNGLTEGVEGSRPDALSWLYTQRDNRLLQAIKEMSHANNIGEFKAALPKIHAPGLNIMYGDAEGNVAWWASAKLYKMPEGINTKFILDGSSAKQEPVEYLDFSENPQAINPPWHYVYSANNQPDSIAGMLYPGYYLPENRAKRIVQLLGPKNDWDREDVKRMITDGTSSVNPTLVADLAKSLDIPRLSPLEIKELDKISNWKGDYPLDSEEATIFHRWIYFFLKNTFEDELGPEQFKQLLATHFCKRLIAPLAAKSTSVWWDNVNTKDIVETKNTIVNTSYQQAINSLRKDFGENPSRWTWNKVHTVEHQHPIGKIAALRSFFNVGPFPVSGSREVINNMYFPYDESLFYKVNHGPSTRRIIDFSDIGNSISILPTGQSGNPLSPHYKDQAEMFIRGDFRKMQLNKDDIVRSSNSLLIFKPEK